MQNIVIVNTVVGGPEWVRDNDDLFVSDDNISFKPFLSILVFGMKMLIVLKDGKLQKMKFLLGKMDVFWADDRDPGIPEINIFFRDSRDGSLTNGRVFLIILFLLLSQLCFMTVTLGLFLTTEYLFQPHFLSI